MSIQVTEIGKIHTPYKQKFAIPRQPGLVPSALGKVVFNSDFSDPNYLRGIEEFSHLWLLFHFHQTAEKGHSPLVRPPRLGGNTKQGVFATRSTFRPNNIGMSVVELVDWQHKNKQLSLTVRGMDLLDGTPIIDIKPYIPYADKIDNAIGGFAHQAPKLMEVDFTYDAAKQLLNANVQSVNLTTLITEVLSQDPRPAYQSTENPDKQYGMTLYNFNIQWRVVENKNIVFSVEKIN
ncbi:tRNA (N6-threonylcarbamoyladenosine(37)-N6)-methyltransferase TrmO [Paraglaciecola aquimarina]|uniref:tRNA (N6-threonylcarbamoyladenosine(37)-N6)-methyltransferase TrmO n=1 Tax=Paraglaciecola algarum TaxID=3050085 RepID=A0ABS9D770_9ALTE|nr:tRNA (N6-threonylcarbamoyladenosine(37)-N6)-methyltransferase TrmO [Paraglaciecola sp. G1-23]MCF2948240.1 tRNA (N6-threonylcarbamoyladenosine(37)-N6)-methyltransferase TrmO [Paraglaciecola sp. G1-23]